jgi:hypothetical protein
LLWKPNETSQFANRVVPANLLETPLLKNKIAKLHKLSVQQVGKVFAEAPGHVIASGSGNKARGISH